MFGRKQTQIKGHIIQNSFFAKWFEFLKILGIKKWESGRLLLITSGRRVLGEWGRWSLGFGSIKDNNKCRESTPMLISPIVFPASEVLPPPLFFFEQMLQIVHYFEFHSFLVHFQFMMQKICRSEKGCI